MSNIYSSHIFMFPFRFDYVEDIYDDNHEYSLYNRLVIEKRVDIQKLNKRLTRYKWQYEEFIIKCKDRHLLYSEFAYFYDYAKDGIYNHDIFDEKAISNFYRRKDLDGKTFEINILEKGEGTSKIDAQTYKLTIAGITLRVFYTGVAILSIELENHKYHSFKDILRINDYGRRVYPQFIGKEGVCDTKKTFLANRIRILGIDIEEDFEDFDYKDTHIGQHIMKILGEDIFCSKKPFSKKQNKKYDKFYIQPSLDDRMFVLSWYGNDLKSNYLTRNDRYKHFDDWYKYVFVDNNWATVQNFDMKKKLLKDATYDRWSNNGTLYGITRYSMVSLTDRGGYGTNIIQPHMHSMYFQMMILLLANRTSILRFSDEIAAVASDFDNQKLTILYERYLIFYNRLYFKEVTHQDQGIELYDIALKQMKIDEHMTKLDGKFTKLFGFADLQAEKKRNRALDYIQIFGASFLVPSFVATIFGLDGVKEGLKDLGLSGFCQAGILVVFAVTSGAVVWSLLSKNKKE